MRFQTAVRALLAPALCALSMTANALTIGQSPVTEVGGLDLFVYASTKNELANSNPGTEESWIESVLGIDVDYIQYGSDVPITATNEDASAYAWQLAEIDADYFLVKNAAYWAIFENLAEQSYAVVDADSGDLPEGMNFGNATISHYGVASDSGGNPPSEIPTPAPFALIGIGLAGLAWRRRSKA